MDVDDLLALVDDIVPFQMKHNAEAEAVDLLMEVQRLGKLINPTAPVVDERNYERVCLYLLRSADYVSDPDDLVNLLTTAYSIYKDQQRYTDALRVALKMDDAEKIRELFGEETSAPDLVTKQMAFMLGRSRSAYVSDDEGLNEIIGNATMSERYLAVARDLGVMDPKSPEDIYKTHLLEGGLATRRGANAAARHPPLDVSPAPPFPPYPSPLPVADSLPHAAADGSLRRGTRPHLRPLPLPGAGAAVLGEARASRRDFGSGADGRASPREVRGDHVEHVCVRGHGERLEGAISPPSLPRPLHPFPHLPARSARSPLSAPSPSPPPLFLSLSPPPPFRSKRCCACARST